MYVLNINHLYIPLLLPAVVLPSEDGHSPQSEGLSKAVLGSPVGEAVYLLSSSDPFGDVDWVEVKLWDGAKRQGWDMEKPWEWPAGT